MYEASSWQVICFTRASQEEEKNKQQRSKGLCVRERHIVRKECYHIIALRDDEHYWNFQIITEAVLHLHISYCCPISLDIGRVCTVFG